MEFTVKIPYRRVVLQVNVQQEAVPKVVADPTRDLHRQNLISAVEKDIEKNRIDYFMIR